MTLQHDKPIAEIDQLLTYVANVEAAAETDASSKVALELMTPDCFADRFGEHPPPISNGDAAAYAGFSIRGPISRRAWRSCGARCIHGGSDTEQPCAAVCGNLVQFTQASKV